jgi:cation diffusion facilitator family transporter
MIPGLLIFSEIPAPWHIGTIAHRINSLFSPPISLPGARSVAQEQFGTRAVRIAFAANLTILAVKAVSAYITGSAALFSETLHSLADSMNSVFLIVGLQLAMRPPDRKHPFGYGKETYFWSFMAAMFMLGVISVSSIYRGYEQVAHSKAIENIDVAIAGLVISVCLESVAVYFAVQGLTRCANQTAGVCTKNPFKAFFSVHDPTLKLIFVEDFTALVGVLIALVAIGMLNLTGIHELDGYASITIGIVLGILAVFLARENREKLLGLAADEGTERRISHIAMSQPGIKDVLSVRTMFMGTNKMIVHLVVEFEPDIRLEKLDDLMQNVEKRIKEHVPSVLECFIEPVPDLDAIHDEY